MLRNLLRPRLPKIVALCLITTLILSVSVLSCEITIFDCAQGNAVVAKYKKQTMIFDAGRNGHSKFVQYESDTADDSHIEKKFIIKKNRGRFINFIVQTKTLGQQDNKNYNNTEYENNFKEKFIGYVKGENTLKAIFLSHPDIDHYNLVAKYSLEPQAFILGGYYYAYDKKFLGHLNRVKKSNSNLVIIKQDKRNSYNKEDVNSVKYYTKIWNENKKCSFTKNKGDTDLPPIVKILSVNEKKGYHTWKNADSMIVKITYQHKSMIIPGDAEAKSWKEAETGDIRANFLLLSHHGSSTNKSTTPELLDKIKPHACFISAGLEHHHPSSFIINMLLRYFKDSVYRTDPHFITYFYKEQTGSKSTYTLKTRVTNAPIFTTIDNGSLKFNLSLDLATVKVERNFIPTPDERISDESYIYNTYFDIGKIKKVSDYEGLKKLNGDKKPKKDLLLEDIYVIKHDNTEEYFFKYGTAYFQGEYVTEEIEDNSDDGSDSEKSWTSQSSGDESS